MPYIKDKRLRVPFNELKKKYIHLYIFWVNNILFKIL